MVCQDGSDTLLEMTVCEILGLYLEGFIFKTKPGNDYKNLNIF